MNKRIILAVIISVLVYGGSMLQFSYAQEADANRFNRLFMGGAKFNLPPMEDGIHDPENIGTAALQTPMTAFESLPKSRTGNRVDWVKALRDGAINPRADRYDPDKKMTVLDLNIIRQVKGTMPDVVYPHDRHTEWLDCKNCHPKIFKPKKGSNKLSMAAILMGEYCGVCHGKVAFPLSQCRRCHSKKKTAEELEQLKKKRIHKTDSSQQGNNTIVPDMIPLETSWPRVELAFTPSKTDNEFAWGVGEPLPFNTANTVD